MANRIGHNGPPEDPFDPSTMYYENIDPRAPNDTLRSIVDLPDLGGKPAIATEEDTLAVAHINGRAVLGVNSLARSYTSYDRAAADARREQLLRKYPGKLNTQNKGRMPNKSIYHAEATVLLRTARVRGGTLRGMRIIIDVDREFCKSCEDVLPSLAFELGDPEVTIIGPFWFSSDFAPWQLAIRREMMKRSVYFCDFKGKYWPTLSELSPYFLTQKGNERWSSGGKPASMEPVIYRFTAVRAQQGSVRASRRIC